MTRMYWIKQEPGKPAFPELEWSRPENKSLAGKLAIIGGNSHAFSAPAQAYVEAGKAGIGMVRVLMPQSLKKTTGHLFDALEFAPNNPSGSFSQASLASWLDLTQWADGVLIAGNLGKNSETEIVFESFLKKYKGQLTLTGDAVGYALTIPNEILNRPGTTLVLDLADTQKLSIRSGATIPITQGGDLLRLVDALHNLTSLNAVRIVTKYEDTMFVAVNGSVCTTRGNKNHAWQLPTAAHAAVWQLQNPTKPFEALTSSISVNSP